MSARRARGGPGGGGIARPEPDFGGAPGGGGIRFPPSERGGAGILGGGADGADPISGPAFSSSRLLCSSRATGVSSVFGTGRLAGSLGIRRAGSCPLEVTSGRAGGLDVGGVGFAAGLSIPCGSEISS